MTTEFNTGEVDVAGGRLVSWDDREVPFDLMITIPPHAVAHFEGETLENIRRLLDGRELEPSFDGHTNCFIETAFHKG